MRIRTISEAKQKLAEAVQIGGDVWRFLESLSDTMSQFGIATVEAQPARMRNQLPMPDGFSERIKAILKDFGKAMRPTEIVDRYQELKWTEPDGGRAKLYDNIAASLSYLVNKQKSVKRDEGKYSLIGEKK